MKEIEHKLQNEFKSDKNELIAFYLYQLGKENYIGWDNFIKQFDDFNWKNKNKAIIENLVFALNCSFDEVNKQKIEQLDKDIKDKAQELLNKRIAMENENEFALKEKQLEQNKKKIISFYIAMLGDDIYQYYFDDNGGYYLHYDNGSEFVTQFDNLEGKKTIIEKLAFALNCSFDEVNKQKIEQLDKDIKNNAKELLVKRKKNEMNEKTN